MTYREKLELYSQGKLDEQQRIEIEKELEKQEALADYLFEHQAPPGMEDLFDGTPAFGGSEEEPSEVNDDSEAIARQINSSIRKAFIKTGTIAAIAAIALTLLVVFAMPHIVSAFYYNPGKVVETDSDGNEITQLGRDMGVYAEMSLPELGTDITAGTDSYGYGNYSYYMDAGFSIGDNEYRSIDNVYTGNIKRNSFVCYNYEELNKYQKDSYLYLTYDLDDDAKKSVSKMKADDLYYAYVALDKEIPYEKFYADYVNNDEYGTNASWVWCGVKVSDEYVGHDREGFYARTNDGSGDYASEKKARKHFLDLVQYFSDNDKFMSLYNHLEPVQAGGEKEYISENGMNIYGFIYVSDKEHIERVANADGVKQVAVIEID